jgi:hypothetical protein
MSTNEGCQLTGISKAESNNQEELDYEIVKDHPNYFIMKEYPDEVFNRKTGRQVTESLHSDANGYRHLFIDSKYIYKDRLIANQWIPNDDPIHKTQIDHINGIKYDNRIENLRHCTAKENCNNKYTMKGQVITYKDDLSDDSIQIISYGVSEFDNLYFDEDCFWIYNGLKYRKIEYHKRKDGLLYVFARANNNKQRLISLIKIKESINI